MTNFVGRSSRGSRARGASRWSFAGIAMAVVSVLAGTLVGCTAAPEMLTLVSGAGAPLPALLDERTVPDGEGGTIELRTVVERGSLRVDGDRYVHDVVFLAYDGAQLIGRNATVDRGIVDAVGPATVGQTMTFASDVLQNHGFTGVRTAVGIDVMFDLAALHGETAVVTLVYER